MSKKKALFVLFGIIFLFVAGFFLLKAFYIDRKIPQVSGIQIEAVPKSKIYLNNQLAGEGTFSKEDLLPGDYVVRLEPSDKTTGVTSWEGKVKLIPGSLTYIKEDLTVDQDQQSGQIVWLEKIPKNDSGEIAVVSTPDAAGVYLDGLQKGNASLLIPNVSAGDHEIRVAQDQYSDEVVQGKVIAGFRLNIVVKLGKTNVIQKNNLPVSSDKDILGSSTPSAQPEIKPPYVVIKTTPTGFLRVRFEPSLTATEVAKINPGEKYSLLTEQDGWSQIKIGETIGWANDQYLDKVK